MTRNSVKLLYLIINETNEYTDADNKDKYLALVHTDKGKDALKKYRQLWQKFKDVLRSTSNSSDNYNQKYMKIRFNSNYYLTRHNYTF